MVSLLQKLVVGICLVVLGTSTLAQSLGPGARPVGQNWSRSPVFAQNGLAATAHPLASQIAIDVLKAGGSAVDAAIAANAALGLMEPTGNGIGGDLFAIVWDPKASRLIGYNGSGRSSSSQTLSELSERIDALKREGKLGADFEGGTWRDSAEAMAATAPRRWLGQLPPPLWAPLKNI